MKYIIMAGTNGAGWDEPRQLVKIGNERLIDRTIRLLREAGVDDICISSNDRAFTSCCVPILHHENKDLWINGFYPMTEPVCYIMGDVFFSPEAIKSIVDTPTDSIEFFASSPPFSSKYIKEWAEPFAFKVENPMEFICRLRETKGLWLEGRFVRRPISWELWQVIKKTPLNIIDYTNYVAINDYTCDIDTPEDAKRIRSILGI